LLRNVSFLHTAVETLDYAVCMSDHYSTERPAKENRNGALIVWFLAIALLALIRYRSQPGAYKSFHVWMDGLGVPAWVRNSDTEVIMVLMGVALWILMRSMDRDKTKGLLSDIGLRCGLLKGIVVGGVFCIPIVALGVGCGLMRDGVTFFEPKMIRIGFTGPFAEEWFFRGVLVLAMVRIVGVKFWTAAIVSGVLFGLVHVQWSAEGLARGWPALLVTGAGGVWFAWLANRWSRNLYVPITMHMLMNLVAPWYGDTDMAMGSLYFEVGRAATITLGTVLTIHPGLLRMSWAKDGRAGASPSPGSAEG
jgi:membrane protease YdiL (CAAX protease family)